MGGMGGPTTDVGRRVVLGAAAVLLVAGGLGVLIVHDNSTSTSPKVRSSVAQDPTRGQQPPATAQPEPSPATTAPPPAASAAPAAAGPFWAVVVASFPATPIGTDAANSAAASARTVDPAVEVIHTDIYPSLRTGYLAVIGGHLTTRDAALAEANRLRGAGFGDADPRCVTTGPPCP